MMSITGDNLQVWLGLSLNPQMIPWLICLMIVYVLLPNRYTSTGMFNFKLLVIKVLVIVEAIVMFDLQLCNNLMLAIHWKNLEP